MLTQSLSLMRCKGSLPVRRSGCLRVSPTTRPIGSIRLLTLRNASMIAWRRSNLWQWRSTPSVPYWVCCWCHQDGGLQAVQALGSFRQGSFHGGSRPFSESVVGVRRPTYCRPRRRPWWALPCSSSMRLWVWLLPLNCRHGQYVLISSAFLSILTDFLGPSFVWPL